MSSAPAPIVDPIRKPHWMSVDSVFRAQIKADIDHCRALLTYLRER